MSRSFLLWIFVRWTLLWHSADGSRGSSLLEDHMQAFANCSSSKYINLLLKKNKWQFECRSIWLVTDIALHPSAQRCSFLLFFVPNLIWAYLASCNVWFLLCSSLLMLVNFLYLHLILEKAPLISCFEDLYPSAYKSLSDSIALLFHWTSSWVTN